MKTKLFAAMAVLVAAAMTGCAGQKEAKTTSGINLENLDTTVAPSQDFYRYACGGWMKNHPLTDEYSRYGTFEVLIETTANNCRNLSKDWLLSRMNRVRWLRRSGMCITWQWIA